MGLILVVEDSLDNFDLVDDALDNVHSLAHAKTGLDGLAQAKALKPDLVLLDMGLPDMDGWTVVAALKSDPALASIPVIAVTAHAMNGDQASCLEAGCDDYLAKPISVRGLLASVERHLTNHRVSAIS